MDFRRSFSSLSSCPDIYNWNGSYNLILQHYNFTGRLQHRKPSKTSTGIITVLFLCVSIFIVLENLMVLLAVLFRVRLRHRWIFICIFNIALSDLLTGSAYVVNICMSGERTFKLSPVLWLFREGLLFVALAASIFSLLLIAVERYATMMKPVHQKTATKTYRIYMMVGLCWMTALVIGFLPLMGWNCLCNLESCSTLLPLYSKSYILFALVIFFIILLTIGALYFAIYCHVRSSTETMMTVRSSKRSLRLLKAVISIVGVFMVCWGPLFILLLVDFFCYSRRCSTLFSPGWVIAMAVLNSAMNPLIYSFGSLELRKAISTLLCCCCVKVGLVDPKTLKSKETSSTSGSRHSSLRNSFSKVRNLSTSPPPEPKSKKTRLSSTTSCLSASSG